MYVDLRNVIWRNHGLTSGKKSWVISSQRIGARPIRKASWDSLPFTSCMGEPSMQSQWTSRESFSADSRSWSFKIIHLQVRKKISGAFSFKKSSWPLFYVRSSQALNLRPKPCRPLHFAPAGLAKPESSQQWEGPTSPDHPSSSGPAEMQRNVEIHIWRSIFGLPQW